LAHLSALDAVYTYSDANGCFPVYKLDKLRIMNTVHQFRAHIAGLFCTFAASLLPFIVPRLLSWLASMLRQRFGYVHGFAG
jgi:hypothetical protein